MYVLRLPGSVYLARGLLSDNPPTGQKMPYIKVAYYEHSIFMTDVEPDRNQKAMMGLLYRL